MSFRCGSGKILYLYGKTGVTLEEIPKSRDKLEEIEKYAVPDETGILYEDTLVLSWSVIIRKPCRGKRIWLKWSRSDSLCGMCRK